MAGKKSARFAKTYSKHRDRYEKAYFAHNNGVFNVSKCYAKHY